jgi:hypothetical protein
MQKLKLLLVFIAIGTGYRSQPIMNFNKERQHIDQQLMIGLGTWAVSNFTLSGYGWATASTSQEKYFHQMNVMWNTVNLALAVPGYIRSKNANLGLNEVQTLAEQRKTQKIFLVNSALDLGYMASGFVLKEQNSTNPNKEAQLQGYGNSLLLQGGFLLLFDLSAYWIHQHHGYVLQKANASNLKLSTSGVDMRIIYKF